jgi:predicted acyltransferase
MNAIVVFTLSGLIARTLNVTGGQKWLWQSVFEPVFSSSLNASLAHAITHVLLLLGIAWILYARNIFIKV